MPVRILGYTIKAPAHEIYRYISVGLRPIAGGGGGRGATLRLAGVSHGWVTWLPNLCPGDLILRLPRRCAAGPLSKQTATGTGSLSALMAEVRRRRTSQSAIHQGVLHLCCPGSYRQPMASRSICTGRLRRFAASQSVDPVRLDRVLRQSIRGLQTPVTIFTIDYK